MCLTAVGGDRVCSVSGQLLFFLIFALNDLGFARDVFLPTDVLESGHASTLQHDMEVSQMPKEKERAQVEKARNKDEDLELDQEDGLVDTLVRFNGRSSRCKKIVDNENVCDVVYERKEKDIDYQTEKEVVVSLSDAVVQPAAVVVKVINAAIAGSTVLCRVENMRLANITLVLILRPVKDQAEEE